MIFCAKEMLVSRNTKQYHILTVWKDTECQLSLENRSNHTIRLHRISVLEMEMPFEADTPVYGEAYNMLCQYGGTVSNVELIGQLGDSEHYKLPAPEGFQQVYNMVHFMPQSGKNLLMGFSSCNRFSGEFWFNEKQLQVIMNLEGIEIAPGETIELESLFAETGQCLDLNDHFAAAIQRNHPMLQTEEIPTGWCSWLIYGPQVTAQNVYDNMAAIEKKELNLKYIQIDDGYQPYMGDWLSTADAFEGGIENLCLTIKERGFEPAIWVAPFIAEEKSELFQSHPDWFVKDEDGTPLASNKVSFGGWRCAPWYMLDATKPEAREFLTHVFRTTREKWKVKYFKLDANMWGAMPFGEHFEKNRTCIESYRMGMKAILEGAGSDSFLLGCNAPMWASIGLVHGMRVTYDNARKFDRFASLAKECFGRNWQHNKLWINDPDTVLLRNSGKIVLDPAGKPSIVNSSLTRNEFLYNAAYVLASGGMVLSGDDIAEFTEQDVKDIKKLLPPTGVAAVFDTEEHSVGRISFDEEQIICVFNDTDRERDFQVNIEKTSEVTDYWTEENLGIWNQAVHTVHLAGHSALALRCRNGEK